ncbi:hypothetical protein RRF57_012976 [Xylaria bambusicola]|uniref:Uncharacterized protein n=1 Tax=Xylaria bambusicola TaxID=326684 RepID=A0AAN7V656_9PEZI
MASPAETCKALVNMATVAFNPCVDMASYIVTELQSNTSSVSEAVYAYLMRADVSYPRLTNDVSRPVPLM